MATYYSRTGELDVDPVDRGYLAEGARRCLAATRVLLGRDQVASDGSTCPACRLLLRRPPVVVSVDGAEGGGGSTDSPGPAPADLDVRVRPVDPVVTFPRVAAA